MRLKYLLLVPCFWLFAGNIVAQEKSTNSVGIPICNFRVQAGIGSNFQKGNYIPFRPSTPTTSSTNTLAGFYRNPSNPSGYFQFDYDIFSWSDKLSVFVGLNYMYNQWSFDAIKDSLLVYQSVNYGVNTDIVRRVFQSHTMSTVIAVNGEKTLHFFSEVGLNISIQEFTISTVTETGKNNASSYYLQYYGGGTFLYTAIGYGFNIRPLRITPNLRYAYYPFEGQHVLALGLSVQITRKSEQK